MWFQLQVHEISKAIGLLEIILQSVILDIRFSRSLYFVMPDMCVVIKVSGTKYLMSRTAIRK